MRSKIYKSKNDIPFSKFNQFVQAIEGLEKNGEYVAVQIKEIFETEDFEAFDKAMKTKGLIDIPFKIDLDFQQASKWIDCDTLTSESEIVEFLKVVLKPKHWYSKKINFEKISLEQAEYVTSLFTNGQPI
jgi:uncharacterized protein (UPF0335 family)